MTVTGAFPRLSSNGSDVVPFGGASAPVVVSDVRSRPLQQTLSLSSHEPRLTAGNTGTESLGIVTLSGSMRFAAVQARSTFVRFGGSGDAVASAGLLTADVVDMLDVNGIGALLVGSARRVIAVESGSLVLSSSLTPIDLSADLIGIGQGKFGRSYALTAAGDVLLMQSSVATQTLSTSAPMSSRVAFATAFVRGRDLLIVGGTGINQQAAVDVYENTFDRGLVWLDRISRTNVSTLSRRCTT